MYPIQSGPKNIHYHSGICDRSRICVIVTIGAIALTTLVLGILTIRHAESIYKYRFIDIVYWRFSVLLLTVASFFLLVWIVAIINTCFDYQKSEYKEKDAKWISPNPKPQTYTFLGNSVAVTNEQGDQENHLFQDNLAALAYIETLKDQNFVPYCKLSAETGSTIYIRVEEPLNRLTLEREIMCFLDIEPWELAFQNQKPVINRHQFMNPPQNVYFYSVLTSQAGKRSIHFFLDVQKAQTFFLTLS